MAKYFFETETENLFVPDDEGSELSDDAAARAAAIVALPDIAKDMTPEGDRRVLTIRVLNEDRELIYKSTLTFDGGWTVSGRASASLRQAK